VIYRMSLFVSVRICAVIGSPDECRFAVQQRYRIEADGKGDNKCEP